MEQGSAQGHSKSKGNQNIQVYLRVRPFSVREQSVRTIQVVDVPTARDVNVRQAHDAKNSKKFTFDRVFGVDSKQKDVYSSVVAPFIGEVLSGYNCTVFAYGQTGTGKTFTMVGDDSAEPRTSWDDDCLMGIIPRAVVHLFDELRMMDVEFSMRISYLELYNEELCDLLGTDDNLKIRIYDDTTKKGSVIVQGLEEIPVHSKDDVYKLLAKGQERRKTAATLMNAQSSRSHTVFSILVHIKENGIDGEDMLKIGKLNLVDLAGSENITKAGNEKGIRTRETVNINQSLLTLGRVITALVERQPHIPYRESKLTRLLQESLGGRTKTSIIATISPGNKDLEETLNTLDYAHRAKNIQNRPEINQRLTKKTVLKEYTEEIDRLKRELNAAREKSGIYLPGDQYEDMMHKLESQMKELNEKILTIRAIKSELEKKEQMFDELQGHLDQKKRELRATSESLNRTNLVLRDTRETLKVTEQRYEESTHLVQVHQRTENVLTGQANDLVQVADEASKHTYGLHDAIQRRMLVDDEIRDTVQNFGTDLHVEMDVLQKKVIKHYSEMHLQSLEMIKEVENDQGRSKVYADGLRKNIQDMENTHISSLKDSLQIFSYFREKLIKSTDDNCATLVQMLENAQQRQMEHHGMMANYVAEMRSMEKKNDEIRAHFSVTLQSFQKKMHENVDKFMGVYGDFVRHTKQFTDVTLLQRNEAMKKKVENQENHMAKMVELLEVLKQDNRDIMSHLNENSADRVTYNEKLNANTYQMSEHHENMLNVLTTFDEERCDAEAQTTNIAKECKKIVRNISENDERSSENIRENVNEMVKVVQGQRQQRAMDVEDVSRQIDQCQVKSTKTMHFDYLDALKKINNEEVAVCESHKSLQLGIDEGGISSHEFKESTCDHIHKIKTTITDLYTNKLKTYTSTGETPIRKEYEYNRQLAATSPHERILNRYRENLRVVGTPEEEQENLDVDNKEASTTSIHDNSYDERCLRELHFNTYSTPTAKKRSDLTNMSESEKD